MLLEGRAAPGRQAWMCRKSLRCVNENLVLREAVNQVGTSAIQPTGSPTNLEKALGKQLMGAPGADL